MEDKSDLANELIGLNGRLQTLEAAVTAINERNRRVELDKAWEVSLWRKASVAILTYVTVSMVFLLIGAGSPFVNAVIPTVGYLLSTAALPFIRRLWSSLRASV